MINRIKFLTVLILGVVGLSGCVLVEDDYSTYSPYPYGSYEAAIDYYHRPPRHHYHKYKANILPKDNHLDKHHHDKKQPPKAHDHKKPEHPTPKKEDIKHSKPEHPAPRKEDIKHSKPEHSIQPIKEKIHNTKVSEHPAPKKEIKNLKHEHHMFKRR